MKIVDYSKQGIFVTLLGIALIIGSVGSDILETGLQSENNRKLALFALILTVGCIYRCFYSWHHYTISTTGIDYTGFMGIRKQHFDWFEMQTFALCRVSEGKKDDFDVIVLSKLGPYELNLPAYSASPVWYWKRNKYIVMFRYNSLRYEYICRYCNQEVLDLR